MDHRLPLISVFVLLCSCGQSPDAPEDTDPSIVDPGTTITPWEGPSYRLELDIDGETTPAHSTSLGFVSVSGPSCTAQHNLLAGADEAENAEGESLAMRLVIDGALEAGVTGSVEAFNLLHDEGALSRSLSAESVEVIDVGDELLVVQFSDGLVCPPPESTAACDSYSVATLTLMLSEEPFEPEAVCYTDEDTSGRSCFVALSEMLVSPPCP